MKTMRKLTRVIITVLLITVLLATNMCVSASSPIKSYTYDSTQTVKAVPLPYDTEKVFSGANIGINSPEDMHVYNDKIYILDSGNKRVVVLNGDLTLNETIVFTQNGAEYGVSEPKGIFVNKNGIYIADREGAKVFLTDFTGNVIREYTKPETLLLSEENLFLPLKIIVDGLNRIYILVENEYRGAVMIDSEGAFLGFFGGSSVKVTAEVLMQNFWRKFKTDDQLNYSKQSIPVEYKNFTIDDEDFIYAVEGNTTNSDEPLRKMNSGGTNILAVSQIGDIALKSNNEKNIASSFISLAVDDDGFLSVLDSTWGRIFQYNQDGELLYVFGGIENKNGTFKQPIDITAIGDKLLVIDKDTAEVTMLAPTEFAKNIRLGCVLFENGLFEDSLKPWQNVLRIDGNYDIAYVGIGKVHLMNREYVKAMEYFKAANSQENYSIAFKRYRNIFLRENFNIFIIVLAAVIGIIVGVVIFLKKKKLALPENKNFSYVWYCLRHPIEGFAELKYNNLYCYPMGFVFVILFALVQIISYFETGFIFNSHINSRFNIFITVGVPLFLISAFIIVNWLMSSFFEGTGKLNQVFTVVTYSLFPLIVTQLINVLLSNVLTLEEGVFMNYISVIGYILFAFILIFGLGSVHMLDFKINIALLLVTVIGIVLAIFIIFLMFNLFAECAGFIETLVKEIAYRSSVGF